MMRIGMLALGMVVAAGTVAADTAEFVCEVSVNGGPKQAVVARATSEPEAVQVAKRLYQSEQPNAMVDVKGCSPR
jgi:hypothetical protein